MATFVQIAINPSPEANGKSRNLTTKAGHSETKSLSGLDQLLGGADQAKFSSH
jgi:hypothetical protein